MKTNQHVEWCYLKSCNWVLAWECINNTMANEMKQWNIPPKIEKWNESEQIGKQLFGDSWGFLRDLLWERLDPVGLGVIRESSGSEKEKRPSGWDYWEYLQPAYVLQCLEDKHITICALGPKLGMEMPPFHCMGYNSYCGAEKDVSRRLNRGPWGEVSHSRPLQLTCLDAFCMYQQVGDNLIYHLCAGTCTCHHNIQLEDEISMLENQSCSMKRKMLFCSARWFLMKSEPLSFHPWQISPMWCYKKSTLAPLKWLTLRGITLQSLF